MALASAALLSLAAGACSPQTATPPTGATSVGTTAPSHCPAGFRGTVCVPRPTAPPQVADVTGLSSIAFEDRLHGWAVGYDCAQTCLVELAATHDGGTTWGQAVTVGGTGGYVNAAAPPHIGIRFVGRDGWIFGPGILETHDGGQQWAETEAESIIDLEPAAGSVWAVEGCYGDVCTPRLLVSAIGSDTWKAAAVQPPLGTVSSNQPISPQVVLERAAGGAAFLSSANDDGSQLLLTSRDAGTSWTKLSAPCTGIVGVRSTDSAHVAVLCSQPCCTGNYVKAFFGSDDGGKTWHQRSAVGPTAVGSIPFYGMADALVVTPAQMALFGGSGSAGIWRSTDSGTNWTPVFNDDCFSGGNSVTQLWFVDASDGWAVAGASSDPTCPSLLRSTDGGLSWMPLTSPLGTARS